MCLYKQTFGNFDNQKLYNKRQCSKLFENHSTIIKSIFKEYNDK